MESLIIIGVFCLATACIAVVIFRSQKRWHSEKAVRNAARIMDVDSKKDAPFDASTSEEPEVFEEHMHNFKLNKAEIDALMTKTAGQGGWQSLIARLQSKFDQPSGQIVLSDKDLDQIRRYAFGYSNGGWQIRLKAIFKRSLGPDLTPIRPDEELRLEAVKSLPTKLEKSFEVKCTAEREASLRTEAEALAAAEREASLRTEAEARAAESEKADNINDGVVRARTPPREPRQYRPPVRILGGQRSTPANATQITRDRATPIEVRVLFERDGFSRASLLPRRTALMPREWAVTGSGDPPELEALQDEWYQDVALENLGDLLRSGIEWAGELPGGRQFRLSLSGRELYVLARHAEISGFVTTPRLVLGEEHVVLCVPTQLSAVRDAIALTGSPEPILLDVDSGVPPGWAGLRGIIPRVPVGSSTDGDILDALRPIAEAEISLAWISTDRYLPNAGRIYGLLSPH